MPRLPSAPGSPGLAGGADIDNGRYRRWGDVWTPVAIPRQSRGLRGGFVILFAAVFTMAGCASKPVGESTRMTIADIEAMAESMAQSLLSNQSLLERGPTSDPWIVSMDKVLNLSDDVMTQNEQWSIMAQVRGATAIQALSDEKAVRFVIPPERVIELRNSPYGPDFDDGFANDRQVTHTMTATFRSVTRAQAKVRSDLYYCEFDLLNLTTGEPVWSDRFEFKRQAKGHVWD